MLDKFHDECGVFGIYDHPEAANITYLGLYSLQHRGQESAGIVTSNGSGFKSHKGMGLVADVFNVDNLEKLPGTSAIGHVRYSTTGASHIKNAQPFSVEYSLGEIAIAHNGNMVNAERIKDELEAYGSIFQTTMDTEIIAHLIATGNESTVLNRLVSALKRVDGSYSMLLLTKDKMIAARDPHGFRPLALGRLRNSYVVASESCAFDLIEGEYIREIEPGEILVIDKNGLKSYKPFDKVEYKPCIFELIYFARPDSNIFSSSVYEVRKMFGKELAKEYPIKADVVIPVPDSGLPAAIGYAEAAGIPFEMGLIRNHYVGRTFIEPKDSIRHFGVKVKLNANREVVKDKRVVVVDDSIVRGTTSRKIIKMIRNAGAKEIHMRISSPPTRSPCFYGIDTPNKGELIAANHNLDEINDYITSDSLGYLSVEGMYRAVKRSGTSFCDACFTGKYPVAIHPRRAPQLALFG